MHVLENYLDHASLDAIAEFKVSAKSKLPIKQHSMPQYPYKTLTFGIEFGFLVATLLRSIKDPLPKLSSEKPAYFPLSNIWRYSDVRKQADKDLDLDFQTAGPVAPRIADVLENRGVPAYRGSAELKGAWETARNALNG